MLVKRFAVALLTVAVGGCASYGGLDSRRTTVQVAQTLPAPDPLATAAVQRIQRIGPLDTVSVEVFGAQDLRRQGMVDASGMFAVPLIGSVQAAGKTPDELAADIANQLRGRYLRDPQVTVTLVEIRSQQVTVDGSVRQPGIYPVVGRMTLQQAIAVARGTDEYAQLNQVVIFRNVNNQQMAALFDLRAIREGRLVDPEIFANDVVVVGQSGGRRVFRDIVQALPVLGVFTPFVR